MAKRVTVDLVDDFDPEQIADETVNFGLDDISYEIDLSSKNAKALRADLQKWVDVARRESGRGRRARGSNATSAQSGLPLAEVRKWAREKLANAECLRQRSTFYLMKVVGWLGPQDLIAYSQEVLLRFGGVVYPHITVALLARDPLPTPILL